MSSALKPRNARETEEAVKWAAAEEQPLEVIGQGSKRGLGRPTQTAHVLDLSELSGVETYEPAELILTVLAGTPIADVEKLVDDNGQELSFEPMDCGPLLGEAAGQGTIGGVIATNLSGPRRVKAGAARDHILGLEAVSGRGEIFNSGGKVVKNVTGYDLPRALCGSYGTLAVATTVTVKVNPKPETSATFQIEGLNDETGVKALCAALGSSAEVSGAAHLPSDLNGSDGRTLLRLEGFETSVDYRFKSLEKLLGGYGPVSRLAEPQSVDLWKSIRDVQAFAGSTTPVWKISVAPTSGPALVKLLKEQVNVRAYYDWSGGLVWLSCEDGADHADIVRSAVAGVGGGHATLVRADPALRSSISVFQPQAAPLASLAARLKDQFDPKGVLNPGRMVSGY